MKTRKEYDSLGQVNVPVDKYWGASTERSKRYFNIGDILINPIIMDFQQCILAFGQYGRS